VAALSSPLTIAITGATSGIGREVARQLAGQGHDLLLLGRSEAKLFGVLGELRGGGAQAHGWAVDVQDLAALQEVFAQITGTCAGLDVLINNAGMTLPDPPLERLDEAVRILRTNLWSTFAVTRLALPLLQLTPSPLIINVASDAAVAPLPTQALYSATKAGMVAFGDALREELRGRGVRVSNLLPGRTRTEILRELPPEYLERFAIEQETRMRVEDVADVVRFLVEQPPSVCIERLLVRPSS
jgi:NADP-dependent 3-hydroxy acid dehydrogenase YdfG